MSASLVHRTTHCSCNCHNHGHASAGFGFPLINATGHPSVYGLNHFSPSVAAQNHTFSSSSAVAAGCTCAASNHGTNAIVEPIVYPFKGGHVKHTHASYRRESIPELGAHPTNVIPAGGEHIGNGHAHPGNGHAHIDAEKPHAPTGSWTLSVPIPVPHGLPNTTLESLVYTVRYASLGAGSASVQTDIVVSQGAKSPEGVITDYAKLPLYSHYGDSKLSRGSGYGPPMLNEALGICLASVPAFKNVGNNGAWSHYLDHQKVYPNVRIGDNESYATHVGHLHADACHVYLFFHVYEYPGAETLRSISVDVSATWNDGAELKKLKEERAREVAEMKLERERLLIMKREAEDVIRRLEATTQKANEEAKRRMEGEAAIEQELKEREEEFISIEKRAKEAYERRLKEEQARLKAIDEMEKKSKVEHEKRMREEETRFKALSEAERKAAIEHEKRMREEAERLRLISEAEGRAREEYLKRTHDEEARFRALSEAERKAEVEHERRMKEEAERLRLIGEAENQAKEGHAKRLQEEEARFKALDEAEAKAKSDYELRLKEEEGRLRALGDAEGRAKEEFAKRTKEEQARLKELEELQKKISDEREQLAREQQARKETEEAERRAAEARRAEETRKAEEARKAEETRRAEEARQAEEARKAAEAASRAVPKISEAPHVADEKMQEHIAEAAARLGQKCKNGYAWEKKAHGYKCSGGGHFISFKDLGMLH